jgi:hypothetical protein
MATKSKIVSIQRIENKDPDRHPKYLVESSSGNTYIVFADFTNVSYDHAQYGTPWSCNCPALGNCHHLDAVIELMKRCYFCDDPDPGWQCDSCDRPQCNSEQCRCFCELSSSAIYDIFMTGGGCPSAEETVAEGLETLKARLWELIQDDKELSLTVLGQAQSDRFAEDVYEEAQRIEKEG